jgi:phosphonate ABC transporter permease subunit PhnE
MARMPRKWRSGSVQVRRFPKTRFLALGVDWIALLFLSLCVYRLIDHWYPAFVVVRPSYRVPFPWYAWIATILGTLALSLVWENLGLSLGFRAMGIRVVRTDGRRAPWPLRLRRLCLDLLLVPPTLVSLGITLAPLSGLSVLCFGLARHTGVSLIPKTAGWAIGPWYQTFGYAVAAFALLLVAGAALVALAYLVLRTVWLRRTGESGGIDRLAGTALASAGDLEETTTTQVRWYKTASGLFVLLLIAFSFYVGWITTKIDLGTFARRASVTSYIWRDLLRPDFSHLSVAEPVLQDSIGSALIETVFMALMATIFGVIFAFPLSFLGARNIMATGPIGWVVYTFMRGVFNVVRSIETIIWAVIFAVWVGFGPFAGVLALTAHTIAALGKLFSEQVESIDPGPLEAIAAAGARRWQVVLYGVIPQIIPSYLAFTMYRWDINVRMSTIIGLVGGGGIGRILFYYKNDGRWTELGAVIILIVAVVWLMDYTSARVRERIA